MDHGADNYLGTLVDWKATARGPYYLTIGIWPGMPERVPYFILFYRDI